MLWQGLPKCGYSNGLNAYIGHCSCTINRTSLVL